MLLLRIVKSKHKITAPTDTDIFTPAVGFDPKFFALLLEEIE